MREQKTPFGLLFAECERKERERIAERERTRDERLDGRMAELFAMACEVSHR